MAYVSWFVSSILSLLPMYGSLIECELLFFRKSQYSLNAVHLISQSTMGPTCNLQNYGYSWNTWQGVLFQIW